jgi:two-component system sensor histidine kinase KdpD
MKRWKLDLLATCLILIGSFVLCLIVEERMGIQYSIPAIFTLSVYIISLFTQGYFFGITASLVSVLAVNFAFTFPYFKFNFTIPENLFSAVIMLAVTITTSTLTTKIRQQRMIQNEIEKEKMRANLLRAVSHDLRTPLTTIYGASSTVIENYDKMTKEEHVELIRGIREDAEWLTHMVENLLSVTRIDGGKLHLVTTPIVLEELIDSALTKFKKRYPEQEVELTMPEEFISIDMDPVLIEQVLMNLLENAVKHAKNMRRLQLDITEQMEEILFQVMDDGVGFSNKDIGIGLSVCETIVKAHGGTLFIGNRPEGGAIVAFALKKGEDTDE